MNKKYLFLVLFCSIFLAGCSKVDNTKQVSPNKYISLIAVCSAAGNIYKESDELSPDNKPDSVVIRTKDCKECLDRNGRPTGYLGDGTVKVDCGNCDFDGDGDVDDSSWGSQEILEVKQEPKDKPKKFQFYPEISDELAEKVWKEIEWHNYTKTAISEANKRKTNILVLLDYEPPGDQWKEKDIVDLVEQKFTSVFGSLDVQTESEWASFSPKHKLVEKTDMGFKFKSYPIICVLSPNGTFISDKDKVFSKVPQDKETLITLLNSLGS
jgi:hypothetical protein